ncbi:triose-phosphate isomerase [Candidatus Woesearchaeota archaeon]|nr:triose-phosphate isomerase [Candidatus Woesearchaeota archaeon]
MHQHPIIIVNFKTYPGSTGPEAVKLAKVCEKVAFETGTDIRVAVAATDIEEVCKSVSIPVYAEHIDPYYPPGRFTGSILPEMIKTAGATGTLLNHSEHQLSMPTLEESVKRAKHVSLVTVVCANSPMKANKVAHMKPDFIALEPPSLIAGDISVSKAKPEIITKAVHDVKEQHGIKLLVGAGIKNKEDVAKALELGADGVLLASGVDLAPNHEKALRELIP